VTDAILTLNAGSSSLKFALFAAQALAPLARGNIEGLGTDPELHLFDGAGARLLDDALDGLGAATGHDVAIPAVLALIAGRFPALAIRAVGHRVVHGGARHAGPALIDDALIAELARLSPLAPLHQPHNLAGVAAARAAFPDAPQVACFDTAFHHDKPLVDDVFAIPRALFAEGVRRYGFHGISYEYVSGRLAEIAPERAAGRVVICHLGSGASMCATKGGRSVASTMGFSALDGLPMGTRPGQLDPGVLLWLMTEKGMDAAALSDLLYKRSGLKGLSGVSNDMRVLEASADPAAREAIEYFVFRARREIGGLAAVLEGLDAIVFCGGIGENAVNVRAAILARMEWLGVHLDPARNAARATVISTDASPCRVYVIPTDEEAVIARHAKRLAG
jgi:acetate kinase